MRLTVTWLRGWESQLWLSVTVTVSPSGIYKGIKLIIFLKVALSFWLLLGRLWAPNPPLNSYLSLWFEFENTRTKFLLRKMQEYSTFTDSFITQVTKFFYNPPRSPCLKIMDTDLAHFMFFTGPGLRERDGEKKCQRKHFLGVKTDWTIPLGLRSQVCSELTFRQTNTFCWTNEHLQ